MKNKTIYTILGILVVGGIGFYFWNRNESNQNFVSGASLSNDGSLIATGIGRKCSSPIPQPPQGDYCRQWEWNKHTCQWDCKKAM